MRKRLPQKCVSIRVCRPALVRREKRRSHRHLIHRHFFGGTLGFPCYFAGAAAGWEMRQWSFFMHDTAGCEWERDSGSVAQRCASNFQRVAMVECCSYQYATRYLSPFRAKHLWQDSRQFSTATNELSNVVKGQEFAKLSVSTTNLEEAMPMVLA